jgi:hypothetical protein
VYRSASISKDIAFGFDWESGGKSDGVCVIFFHDVAPPAWLEARGQSNFQVSRERVDED